MWLLLAAWGPDIDYLWPAVHPTAHNGLRITHSLLGSLIVPSITGLWLTGQTIPMIAKRQLIGQVAIASLSHIGLDVLVGVTPLPLLYPFDLKTIRLPFGILPSAGKIQVTNYYFYRNLYLEMGVLLPLLSGWRLFCTRQHWNQQNSLAVKVMRWGAIACCFILSGYFMHQSALLPRV